METTFTPISGFLGGTLIGAAAILLLLANGRIAGVSGIVGGLLRPVSAEIAWRVAFLGGIWLGALGWWLARGEPFRVDLDVSWPTLIAAGLLVGIGTRMGGGCTSGHGVCGISRFSTRSLLATGVFMIAGAATVFVTRHVL
jgi:uncharacterized membrane protein YedE/YeeE